MRKVNRLSATPEFSRRFVNVKVDVPPCVSTTTSCRSAKVPLVDHEGQRCVLGFGLLRLELQGPYVAGAGGRGCLFDAEVAQEVTAARKEQDGRRCAVGRQASG